MRPSTMQNIILEQCEKGSLLITNGDSDYYLTFYVQQVQGYRKDVRLVNSSLLQFRHMREQYRNTTI